MEYIIHVISLTIILLIGSLIALIILPHKHNFIDPIYLNKNGLSKIPFKSIKNEVLHEINTNPDKFEWRNWPISDQIVGDVKYFPIFIFGKLLTKNYKIFTECLSKKIDLLSYMEKNLLNSLYLIRLEPESYFKVSVDDYNICKNSIKMIILLDCYKLDHKIGISVNDTIKSLSHHEIILFDNSTFYSIFNLSKKNITTYILCADIKRDDSNTIINRMFYDKKSRMSIKKEMDELLCIENNTG